MAKTRRAYTGGAVSTTTTSSIAASGTTSFTITAGTGWPYGSDPFYIVVEPGTASEEKILVTRTGVSDTTINIASDSVRGLDGTAAVSHGSGVTTFPVFTAVDADEANELASKWSAKGDLVSYGSSTFEKLTVGADDTVLVADSGEASGLKWGQVATGGIADGAVTAAKLATGANKLGSGSAVRTLGTFVGGDVLQAAELNAIGTWTSYTPAWTATGTNPVIGNGTLVGQYTQINKLVIAQIDLTCSSTTTFGTGIWIFSLPVTAATVLSNYGQIGIGTCFDSSLSTHRFVAPVNYNLSTTEFIVAADQSVGAPDVSPTVPFTWANTDTLSITVMYRAA